MSNKVLWGEGLFLRPQHFQQQDQYHEHRLRESIQVVHPYAWGVLHLRIDRDALASDVLRVLELSLRFQDGEMVDAPGADMLPEPVDLSALPQSQQSMVYYAALPAFKPFGGNFGPPGQAGNAARFVQSNNDTPDLYTQAAQAELAYLTKSLRLDLHEKTAWMLRSLLEE